LFINLNWQITKEKRNMKTKAGKTKRACGSALLGFLFKAFYPLFNERGEVALSDPNAGAGAGGQDPNAGGSPPQDGTDGDLSGTGDDGAPPAGAQNTDQSAQSTDGVEGQTAGAEPPPPWHKDPRWVKFQEERKAMETEKASYEAQLKQASEIANFYQNQFNEHLKATQAMRGQHPGAQGRQTPGQPAAPMAGAQPPGGMPMKMELPPNIKGPGKWDTQEDEAAYLDHMANHIQSQVPMVAMQATRQVFEQIVQPMIENFTSQIQDMQESFARQANPDYDDVIKAANEAIFTLGPDGKVFGVKNPALLSYIRAQRNPYLALYQHGLTIKAPNKIKAGVDKATKQALRAIGAKPSGPQRPASSSSQVPQEDLDWETPPKQAEKVLAKRGLL
jgi:hypothetical protein